MLKFEQLPKKGSKEWLSVKDFEGEVWRDVKGYEGIYKISIYGRLKSLKYNKERIVKPHITTKKYHEVFLWKDGVKKGVHLHRLVAYSFLLNKNENEFNQINHKDENKDNNTLINLEWCNNRYNANYGTRNKRMSASLKGLHKARLNKIVCQYSISGELVARWKSAGEAACKLGFPDASGINRSCNSKNKIYRGYIWKRMNI